jgi:hypothetical protein
MSHLSFKPRSFFWIIAISQALLQMVEAIGLSLIIFAVPDIFSSITAILAAIPYILPAVTHIFAAIPAIFSAIKLSARMPSFILIKFAIIIAIKAFEMLFPESRFFIRIDGAIAIGVNPLPQRHSRLYIWAIIFSQNRIGICCKSQT